MAAVTLAALAATFLAPVPHVEGIVGLAMLPGTGWSVAALVSLALLPLTLLAPAVGNVPVPVVGFGTSPILGYLAAMGVFLRIAARRPERSSVDSR